MGGNQSSSTTTSKYNTDIVNQVDIKTLSETVNQQSTSSVITAASNCSNTSMNLNDLDFSGAVFKGTKLDLTGFGQGNKDFVTFKCLQESTVKSNIGNSLLNTVNNAIQSNFTTEAIDKIDNAAKNSLTNGALASSVANSNNSSVLSEYNFNDKNQVTQNISNVLKNVIANNFNYNSQKNCYNNSDNQNIIAFKNVTFDGGSVDLSGGSQQNVSEVVSECIQNTHLVSNIMSEMANNLGITIEADNAVKKTTDISNSALAEQHNKGAGNVINSAGDAISNIIQSPFKGIGSMFSGSKGIIISIVCFCLSLLLILGALVAGYFYMKHGPGVSQLSQEGGFLFDKLINT